MATSVKGGAGSANPGVGSFSKTVLSGTISHSLMVLAQQPVQHSKDLKIPAAQKEISMCGKGYVEVVASGSLWSAVKKKGRHGSGMLTRLVSALHSFDSCAFFAVTYHSLASAHMVAQTRMLTRPPQCHTHPKVKDGPKRRRETQAGRARAVSSASASSSSHPVKQESTPTSTVSYRHSTPTPIPGSSALQSFGIPVSTPTATPSLSTSSHGGSTSYPTPTASTPAMYPPRTPMTTSSLHALHTPTIAAFPELRYSADVGKDEHATGLFPSSMQGFPAFSASYPAASPISLAHQVSEPELVGIRATTASLNSIASMM